MIMIIIFTMFMSFLHKIDTIAIQIFRMFKRKLKILSNRRHDTL